MRYWCFVMVVINVKLLESEKQLRDADNKYEVLSLTLHDKQAACDLQQTQIGVSCFITSVISHNTCLVGRHLCLYFCRHDAENTANTCNILLLNYIDTSGVPIPDGCRWFSAPSPPLACPHTLLRPLPVG